MFKYFQNISISRIFRKNIFVFQGFNNNKRFDHFRKTSQVIDHMLFYMTKKVQSSVISLKFAGRKKWVIFQTSNKKIYIFIDIFENKTTSDKILELFLSLTTSSIFYTLYAWKTKFFKNVSFFYLFLTLTEL